MNSTPRCALAHPPLARPTPPAEANAVTPAGAARTGGCASQRSIGAAPPAAALAPAIECSQTDASITISNTPAAACSRLLQPQSEAQRSNAARPRATACDGRHHGAHPATGDPEHQPSISFSHAMRICHDPMSPVPLLTGLAGPIGLAATATNGVPARTTVLDRLRAGRGTTMPFGRDQLTH